MIGLTAPLLTAGAVLAALDPTLPLPLALIQAGLDLLAEQSPAQQEPAAALETAGALLRANDRVQALSLRAVADVHTRDLHLLDAMPSTGTWVAEQRTSMQRSQVALACQLEQVPQVADRIADGALSVDGGVLVAQALGKLRRHVDRPDGLIDGQPGEEALHGVIVDGVAMMIGAALGGLAEDDPRVLALRPRLTQIADAPLPQLTRLESAFLVVAGHVEHRLLRRTLGVLVDALLPAELEQRSKDNEDARGIELRRNRDTGRWSISGTLDDQTGEALHVALTAEMDRDVDNPTDTAAPAALRAAGEDPYNPDLGSCDRPRGLSQRRHDALSGLLDKLLGAGLLGTRHKNPIQVGVTVSLDALHRVPGALPARTDSGATWPLSLVQRLLCDSAITRYVLGLGHRVVETSHTDRTLKAHERRILLLETGGICQAAGCGRGPATGHLLIPHHPVPYEIDPVTSLRDTVLLCEPSHHDLHHFGKTLRLKDGRYLNPSGWTEGPPTHQRE